MLGYYYRWTRNKKNRNVYLKRQLIFEEDRIMVNMEDGSKSEVLYDRIIGITKMNECCLIYLNAASFLYVPFSAFASEADANSFKDQMGKLIFE
ncbi:MAG: YcxB family protein [Bacteroidetes bacterium]|nr:YcxB family protein [Bacteroidota bacterium]